VLSPEKKQIIKNGNAQARLKVISSNQLAGRRERIFTLQSLGPYIILGVLGRGGMGSVYKAKHQETGEIHALKVLSESMNDEDHFRSRFESEIRALIKLNHPNIVRILSYGQEMGKLYFAMELVSGNSLFQIQKKGYKFEWPEVLQIGKQVANGLRHAHDRGVIHRDLKPGNLLMQMDEAGNHGDVKITDFGIAKSFGMSQNTGDNLIGTLDFMSPEQARGEPVTFKSDLYSLGVVMYTLIAGKPPFSGNSFEESLRKLTQVSPPSLAVKVPDVPKSLDRLIQKLMSKAPDKRIPTALALIHKLEELEKELAQFDQEITIENLPEKKLDTFDGIPSQSEIGTKINTNASEKQPLAKSARQSSLPSSPPATPTASSQKPKATPLKETVVSAAPRRSKSKTDRLTDFYNPVTEHVRKQELDSAETANHSRGIAFLLLALIGVVAIGVWGVMYALQPPVADDLYNQIADKQNSPQLVIKEMATFLRYYSEDARADEVSRWQQQGEDYRKHHALVKKLKARDQLARKNNLSELEKQFVDILKRFDNQKDQVVAKLEALVAVYQGVETLEERDKACLEAAEYFIPIYREQWQLELKTKVQFIRNAIELAEAESTSANQLEKYRSIIDLHSTTEWDDSLPGREGLQLLNWVTQKIEELSGD